MNTSITHLYQGVSMRIDGLGLRGETEAQALAAQSEGEL